MDYSPIHIINSSYTLIAETITVKKVAGRMNEFEVSNIKPTYNIKIIQSPNFHPDVQLNSTKISFGGEEQWEEGVRSLTGGVGPMRLADPVALGWLSKV